MNVQILIPEYLRQDISVQLKYKYNFILVR